MRVRSVLTSRVGAGRRDRARVVPFGVELQRRAPDARHASAWRLEAPDEPFERGVADEEKRLERDERPLELHALRERRAAEGAARAGADRSPRAVAWSSRPSSPRRLATSPSGSFASSPIEWMPQRSSVSPSSICGARLASGSGARKRASCPAGTTRRRVGQPRGHARRELRRRDPDTAPAVPHFSTAAMTVAAESQFSGSPKDRTAAGSPPGSRRGPDRGLPLPASSTRGEKPSATSSSASWAARSLSASRPRAIRSGMERAGLRQGQAGADPGAFAPARVAATTRAALPLPSKTDDRFPLRARARCAAARRAERAARRTQAMRGRTSVTQR